MMDDKKLWSLENTTPTRFEKVKVFTADNWHVPVDGDMRGLDIVYGKSELESIALFKQFIAYL